MKHSGKQRNTIRVVIEGLALSTILLLVLVSVMEHSGSAPTAQASSNAGAQASAPVVIRAEAPARAPEAKAKPIAASVATPEALPASLEIRGTESDSGYTYWLEHERRGGANANSERETP
jgi:hypothetical protein